LRRDNIILDKSGAKKDAFALEDVVNAFLKVGFERKTACVMM